MFDWENAIALDTMQGNRAHLAGKGKSHGFSRVAAGTSGIFSSYSEIGRASCRERGIALHSIEESRGSSRIDLGYTEQFHIPLVTSESF